ncbi:Amino acid kinase family protein [Pirellulimonas nuda]|uniref:Amino acid kinase family protein n=1 Tax=Pirellulimonas nuda TaxID=2528009 RepID=A0A518DBB3_9BACT|nr:hypothetical protein [Pirellulimonas nuda]QDU88743.1 Amino acid kinase family protein [Pirellulimonas nuda]
MTKTVIVKIGGSLLRRPDCSAAMKRWLDAALLASPSSHFLLLVGGGELVDRLRELSRRHEISEATAHWLAIDLMAINAQIVADLIPGLEIESSFESLDARRRLPGATLMDVRQVLRVKEPLAPGTKLEATWSTTSDSIAARMAVLLAAELVLLKEACPPSAWRGADWGELASVGLVDASFSLFAAEISHVEVQRIRETGRRKPL